MHMLKARNGRPREESGTSWRILHRLLRRVVIGDDETQMYETPCLQTNLINRLTLESMTDECLPKG